MSSRIRFGRISKFDPSTWWGEVDLSPSVKVKMEFHATCYLGSSTRSLPKVGDQVELVFSDETGTRLLSVSSVSPHLQGAVAAAAVRTSPRKRVAR